MGFFLKKIMGRREGSGDSYLIRRSRPPFAAALLNGDNGTIQGIYQISANWMGNNDNVTPGVEEKVKDSPYPTSAVLKTSLSTNRQYLWRWKEPIGKDGIDAIENLIRRLIHS